MFEQIGRATLRTLEEIGEIVTLIGQTMTHLFQGRFHAKDVFAQMVRVGIDSIPAGMVTAAFVGMVFAVQISHEFVKFGAGQVVGGIMAIAVARELAPAITAVVIAGRVGAAIAAELGSMVVTDQIDAIYALASNPIKHLVVPRFIACSLMLPVITLFADVVGFAGGYLVAVYLVHINPVGYMDSATSFLKMGDITGGLFKSVFFGMIISIVGCFRGLTAKGGAKGVGVATTNSVVTSLMTIFVVNYFLSLVLFRR